MAPTPDEAYERIVCNGKPLDRATTAAVREMESRLGYSLTIMQGIGGAAASSGTHLGSNNEGGRAVDFSPYDWENKVQVGKAVGFAIWHREELPGVWGEHVHGVLILGSIDNDRGIAPAAFRQIGSFLRRRSGLSGDGPDPQPWRVSPQPVFQYPVKETPVAPPETKVTQARDKISEAHALLGDAVALISDTNENRQAVKNFIPDLRSDRQDLRDILDRMPKT